MLRAVPSRTARAIRPATSAWVRRLCVVNAGSETTVANAVAQDKCTVLYFTASWCGPCKMISPIYADLAKKHTGASFIKVDVDDLPDVAQEHNITAMPTFQFWKAGMCLDTIVGADARKLQEQVQLHAATI